ncbi:MAG: DNA polymerase III subunit gamma/tau [Clostridia bacterium]
MAHISLYRRYRPDTFDKLIGQKHIVKTLVNQINSGNISHAYLFTGTRGTGKTSVARIFAKAINCLNPLNGSPCGKCECCNELSNPNNMDIIEIDAASNNTVDEIRDLREKVKYPPVIGKYKVYIIDEVHMMTTSAFNALLKTLEEPPSHVVFILATTDVHKLPATILSRCMRFDFKLLSVDELSQNLKIIFNDIGKKYEDEALSLIATAGEGSVRDSLSIADMCLSFSDEVITYRDVLEVLGASDPNIIIGLVENLINKDTSSALNTVDRLSNLGKNIAILAKDISHYVRDILYIKYCDNSADLLKLPNEIYSKLKAISAKADSARLLFFIDLFNGINVELRYSTQPRIMIEAAVIRATTETGQKELADRLTVVETKVNHIQSNLLAEKKTIKP